MNRSKILKNNEPEFIKHVQAATGIYVHASNTGDYFKIRKSELLSSAEERRICYSVDRNLFVIKRMVLIIT